MDLPRLCRDSGMSYKDKEGFLMKGSRSSGTGSVGRVHNLRVVENARKKRPTYNAEFRAGAVAMVRAGGTHADVAKALGCSDRQIRRWLKQTDVDAGKRAGLTTVQQRELTVLRRANARLQERVQLMEEARAFFATGTR